MATAHPSLPGPPRQQSREQEPFPVHNVATISWEPGDGSAPSDPPDSSGWALQMQKHPQHPHSTLGQLFPLCSLKGIVPRGGG